MISDPHGRRVRALVVAATALALVVALALGYTGSRGLFARPAAPMEKLRIALPALPHAALLYIAAAKGYCAEADAYAVAHVVVGRSEFLKARPGTIEKFVRALLKAEGFNRSEPRQALRLFADQLKLDVKTLEPGWKDFAFNVDLPQSLLIALEDEARWAMARGYVDKDQVPNFLPHLHLDALLAVQPERVTVVR